WLRGILEQALSPAGSRATRPFALARQRLAELHPEEGAESERGLTALGREALRAARAGGGLPNTRPRGDARTPHPPAMGWVLARLAGGRAAERADAERLVDFALAGLARGAAAGAGR